MPWWNFQKKKILFRGKAKYYIANESCSDSLIQTEREEESENGVHLFSHLAPSRNRSRQNERASPRNLGAALLKFEPRGALPSISSHVAAGCLAARPTRTACRFRLVRR